MKFLDWLRKPRKQILIVMRTEDMLVVHPDTDFSYACSRCGAEVGIYPSGQSVIEYYGTERMRILCSHCVEMNEMKKARMAPGAGWDEIAQSFRRKL